MGGWLDTLAHWLGVLNPLVVVRPYQRGVRYLWGRVACEVAPGITWKLPGLADVDVLDVVEQIAELEPQSLTTKDGRGLVIRGAVRYEITDAVAYLTRVQHTDHSIANLCETVLHRVIRRRTLEQIMRGQGGLERRVQGALETRAERWGIRVLDVALTNSVSARHYRLFLNGGTSAGL